MQPISIQRIWLLVQRAFMLNGRKWLGYAGPLLVILLITASNNLGDNTNYFNTVYTVVLVILGFYQASSTLSEHKTADGRQTSLTLPASDTEKFISAWLYSGPIFLILFTVSFYILTWVSIGIIGLFGFGGLVGFNPFDESVLKMIKFFFLVAQPIGLLAAIAFDRAIIPKTFGSLLAVASGIGLLAVVTIRIVYRDAFEGFFTPVGNIDMGQPQMAVSSESPLVLLLILGLTLLAATYFKFQEKSV